MKYSKPIRQLNQNDEDEINMILSTIQVKYHFDKSNQTTKLTQIDDRDSTFTNEKSRIFSVTPVIFAHNETKLNAAVRYDRFVVNQTNIISSLNIKGLPKNTEKMKS